jgi:hypothetical protein
MGYCARNNMKYFFWIAFAVFLAASIPHVAYFFASFEPSNGPEGLWWWGVSYAIAISIDVTVYLLSWTAFQRYRKYHTAKAVWRHWLLIIICTVFSWAVNWAYAKQFHNAPMLSAAETEAPWLTTVFPFMASAFPLLGIVYTLMAETISEDESVEKTTVSPLAEIARQTQLPIGTLRRTLNSGNRATTDVLVKRTTEELNKDVDQQEQLAASITGHFIAVDGEMGEESLKEQSETTPISAASSPNEANSDKLQLTLEALQTNPDISDEALATYLALKRPASARFWRLKAAEILNANHKEQDELVTAQNAWAGAGANGTAAKG